MPQKTIISPRVTFVSHFGDTEFTNVPVHVDKAVDPKSFDPSRDNYALDGDVIEVLEREVVKSWLGKKLIALYDGAPLSMTEREVYGMLVFFGIKAAQLAAILGLTKGTVSKIMSGAMAMNASVTRLAFQLLDRELEEPGYVRGLADAGEVPPPVLNVPKAEFDYRKWRQAQ